MNTTDANFSTLSLSELDVTSGGTWRERAGQVISTARTAGRYLGAAGTLIGAGFDAHAGWNDPSNRTTGDRVAGAVGAVWHGATFGVFRATPAY